MSFEQVKELDHGINFEYYMVSRKGFCHYINGKPNFFIEIEDWLKEKEIYERIKQLKFFSCFRRWKTVKMWKKNVIRHRINTSAALLE